MFRSFLLRTDLSTGPLSRTPIPSEDGTDLEDSLRERKFFFFDRICLCVFLFFSLGGAVAVWISYHSRTIRHTYPSDESRSNRVSCRGETAASIQNRNFPETLTCLFSSSLTQWKMLQTTRQTFWLMINGSISPRANGDELIARHRVTTTTGLLREWSWEGFCFTEPRSSVFFNIADVNAIWTKWWNSCLP